MPCIGQIGDVVETCDLIFEWKIRDFFSLSNKSCDFYMSSNFSFADTRWCLRLDPNNCTEDSQEWVGFYLSRKESGPPKTMNYALGIKVSGQIEEKVALEYKFSEQDEGYGRHRFLLRSDLSSQKSVLMPDNVLTVTCRLRSQDSLSVGTDQAVQTVNVDSLPVCTNQAVQAVVVGEENVLKSLRNMLESGDDSDVVIKVRGKEFPAHRAILRARSTVFRSMFAHEMVEKYSGVVKIEDCDPDTFYDFLAHIYSGSCEQISTDLQSLHERRQIRCR